MKILLICGDRNWKNKELIKKEVKKRKPDCVVEGGQRSFDQKGFDKDPREDEECMDDYSFGADYLGGRVADELGIPHFQCKANWDFYHRAAGPIRNGWQIKFIQVTEVLAFHNNIKKSKGTADMVKQAKRKGIPVTIVKEK